MAAQRSAAATAVSVGSLVDVQRAPGRAVPERLLSDRLTLSAGARSAAGDRRRSKVAILPAAAVPAAAPPSGSDPTTAGGILQAAQVNASAKTLTKDSSAIGDARLAVGTPDKVTTVFDLSQQINSYLRSGFMASRAAGDVPWHESPGAVPLTKSQPRTVQTLGKAGAGLAIGAGIFGTGLAITELEKGQHLQGAKDLAVSGLTTAAGASDLVPAFSRSLAPAMNSLGADAVGTTAGTVSPAAPLAGLACILGGTFQLTSSLEHHQTEHAVEGGAQIVGGSLLTASAFATGSIIGAPAGIVLGALGGLTLFTSAAIQNRHALGKAARWVESKL